MRKYATLIAFLILAFGVYFTVKANSQISDQNLRKMCDTISRAVNESNARIPAHEADTAGLIRFLKGAERARWATYHRTGVKEDKRAAEEYASTIKFVKTHVHFKKLTPLNCDQIVG